MRSGRRQWKRWRLFVLMATLLACARERPEVILWAWERPEDLRSIDPKRVKVAVLERTIVVRGDDVTIHARKQPVHTPGRTRFISVVRIESQHPVASTIPLIVHEIERALRPDVEALQIDYDATVSEREFYTALLHMLRPRLPAGVRLSITALASWCMHDGWIRSLPIDEAVPMLFRMGTADQIPSEFSIPLCRGQVGVATDELLASAPRARRVYVFSPSPWNAARVENALALAQRLQ